MAVDTINVVNVKSSRWQRDEFIIRWSDAGKMDFAQRGRVEIYTRQELNVFSKYEVDGACRPRLW